MDTKLNEKHLKGKLPKYIKSFSEKMVMFYGDMGCDTKDKKAVKRYKEMIEKRMNAQIIGFHFASDVYDAWRVRYSPAERLIEINENYPGCDDEYSIMHEMVYALFCTFDNDKKRIRFGILTIPEEGGTSEEAVKQRIKHRGLNRGFTKMITDMMMKMPESDTGPYPGQTDIARQIRDVFGMGLVFAAMFQGPEVLEEAFAEAGCGGKLEELSRIADEMMETDENPTPAEQDEAEKSPWKGTEELKKIDMYIGEGQFEQAIIIADDYLSGIMKPGLDKEENRLAYYFDNNDEFALFIEMNKEKEQETWKHLDAVSMLDGVASHMIRMKAYSLFELKEHEKAIDVLKRGLREFNPVGVNLRFELIENYFRTAQFELAEKELLILRELVMSKQDIARLYRRIGFCKIEQKDYMEARVCLQYSLWFEKNKTAIDEIVYVDNLLGAAWDGNNYKEKFDYLVSGLGMGICAHLAHTMKLAFIPTVYQENCALSFAALYEKNGDLETAEQYVSLLTLWEGIKKTSQELF